MDDTIVESKTRRKPWTAVMLSAILPGMGHIYCGQIVIGVALMFATSLFFPVLIFDTHRVKPTSEGVEMGLLFMFGMMTVLVGIVALLDSYRQARRTRIDYELKDYNRWYVYLMLIVIFCGGGVGYSLQIRDKYIEAFSVPAWSMAPTIQNGDRVLADKTAYLGSDPERGDVVLFMNPDGRRQNYIKRVVAVAGDTVEIRDGQVYVNDEVLERREVRKASFNTGDGPSSGAVFVEKIDGSEYEIFVAEAAGGDFAKITVPKYCCFVLGDNRNGSRDSRDFGPIPLSSVRGKFGFLYFPSGDWSRFGRVK